MATPNTVPQSAAPSGTSIPGAARRSNPIDQAKTEAECKIPTNATKPECIALMLKKWPRQTFVSLDTPFG